MEDLTSIDRNGRPVRIGSLVKIVDLQMELFDFLEPNEVEDVRSMIGKALPVDDISPSGFVTVSKGFERGRGRFESHSLGLAPEQIEIVDPLQELEYIERARALGPSAEALNVIDESLVAFPTSASLWKLRGDFLQIVEPDHGLHLSEVDRSYRRAIGADPKFADAYFELGQFVSAVMGNPRKAKQYLHKAWLLRRAGPN